MAIATQYEVGNWYKALNLPYREDLSADESYFLILNKIKEYYNAHMDEIIKFNTSYPTDLYPLPFDWGMLLNPIEYEAWSVIKSKGYLPLYPQFPLSNRFLDFGNPVLKIGVEIDGKDFHDRHKDEARDEEFKKSTGWTIIRIPAEKMIKNTFTSNYNPDCFSCNCPVNKCNSRENILNWLYGTGDGVLEAIKVIYFNGRTYVPDAHKEWFLQQCKYTIHGHNSTRWTNYLDKTQPV